MTDPPPVNLTIRRAEPKVRFGGLEDPTPGNSVEVWSRHWYGGFDPRCPKCRELGAGCEAAED